MFAYKEDRTTKIFLCSGLCVTLLMQNFKISCTTHFCNLCSVVFLAILFAIFWNRIALYDVFIPALFPCFSQVLPYIILIFTEKFYTSFIHFLCFSGTKLYHVKIDNTAFTTKWQGMLSSHAVMRVQHCLHIYMYTTAANQVHVAPTP